VAPASSLPESALQTQGLLPEGPRDGKVRESGANLHGQAVLIPLLVQGIEFGAGYVPTKL
jgi:hypothetical protein